MSGGERTLCEILHSEFRSSYIAEQYPIVVGRNTLYLDFYIVSVKLAFEYDGSQHFSYNRFFHRSRQGFEDSVTRDKLKEQWCNDHGATLIRISHRERLTTDLVRSKILETVHTSWTC